MIFALITIPIMLLAIAIATVPVLRVMLRDERERRLAHELASPTVTELATGAGAKPESDFESAVAA